MAAVVFITSKPVDAFLRGQWEPGFKFLPVTYDCEVRGLLSAGGPRSGRLSRLIKPGERIATIAVPTALVSYNWPAGSNRYQRVARFTDHLFSRIDKLQVAGFDPKWKTINLGATVPGLTRFPAAQEWLDRQARKPAESNEDRRDLRWRSRSGWRAPPRWRKAAGDAMEKLRACSLLAHAERMDCLDKLSRDIAPPPARPRRRPTPAAGAGGRQLDRQRDDLTHRLFARRHRHCLVQRRAGRRSMQLSIQCRGGRTELVIRSAAAHAPRRGLCRVLRRQ